MGSIYEPDGIGMTAASVVCSTCGAQVGEPCTRRGGIATYTHVPRERLARLAAARPADPDRDGEGK